MIVDNFAPCPLDTVPASVYSTDMQNITAETKNSDIIRNHDAYGLTMDEAIAFVSNRHAEYIRNNTAGFGKAPKGGWTDADRIAK